jgi:GAF domain-containing protein/PleD family two-component response regulator
MEVRRELVRILLIEDNPGDARLLQETLTEAEGFSFDLAHVDRLAAGLERLEDDDFDIILLDLSLPDSQGLDTFAQVLAHAPRIPVVVLSGLNDGNIALNAVRAGAQDYLVKGTVDGNLLTRAIRYAIERKEAEARQAYYLHTEHVLRQISSRFVDIRNLDQAISDALRDTATVLRTARTRLFTLSTDGKTVSSTHQWTGGAPPSQDVQVQGLETAALPWLLDSLSNNEVVAVHNVDQIPSSDQEALRRLGTQSILAIPVSIHSALYGFLAFEETEYQREWQSEEIGFLRNAAEILSRALERIQAEQFLQQRNLELATLNAVAQALSASLDLNDLLDEALSRTVYAMGLTGGMISLADEQSGGLRLVSYAGLPEPAVDVTQMEGLADRPCSIVHETGEPLELPDLREEAPVSTAGMLEAGLLSYIGVPIVHKDRYLGVLSLFDSTPHAFSEDDHALLTAIGQQIGLAIENARLFEDVAREREVAHTLLDMAEALNTTLQLDRLLERVLDELQRVIPYDRASISLLHGQEPSPRSGKKRSPTAWVVASRGLEQVPSEGFVWEDDPLIRRVVEQKEPVVVPDVRTESDWHPFVKGLESVRSWLCVPLISKGKPLGMLMVDSDQPNAYGSETGRLAFAFAHHAAAAINNSRLYEQARAQLREAVLLHGVTAALSSTLDPDQILPYVARSLCEAMNASLSEIYTLDGATGDITVVAEYMSSPPTEPGERLSFVGQVHSLGDVRAAADALSWGRPVQLSTKDPKISPEYQAFLESRNAQAALILPMVTRGHTGGLAAVWENEGARYFTAGEIAMAQTLTHQGAIAVENAYLFEETRQQVRRTQLLLQTSEASASTLDSTEVLKRTAEAVALATGADMTAMCLLNEEGTALRPVIGHQVPPKWLETYQELLIPIKEHPFVEQAWESRQAIYTSNAPEDPRLDEKTHELFPAVSVLLTPMTVRDEIIGGMWAVWWEQIHPFDKEELQLTEGIVRQAAVAMQNARLFEEVESARIEVQQRAQALEEANVRLQELDRLKSQFLANMSHELRTPLNSVIGFSEVLVDGLLGELPPQQKECAQNILFSGEHLLALINDILDLSKIEAGRLDLDLAPFGIPEWMKEVQATVEPLFAKREQVLEVDVAENLPPLNGDRFRIKQVLLNLLSNANKFTPDGERVRLTCQMEDEHTMLFSVADNGIGIRPEDQEIIFEEFRQAGDSVKKIKGTGLGLTISKRLVELHGGRIWVESEQGAGATFSFLLPIDGPKEPEGDGNDVAAGKTVLVVEAERKFSNLLAFYLRQEGYVPMQHYTGADVLERAVELKPAFITLDLMLPDRDGWEVIGDLKSNPRTDTIPVLVVSSIQDGKMALGLGASDYLVKPVHRSDVHNLLGRLEIPQPQGRKARVLVVDDNSDVVDMLRDMLPEDRYETLVAYDGQQGLDQARVEHPDMILLDLMMPGVSGFEMLEQLRNSPDTSDIPVIVVTAMSVTPEQQAFLDENTQGFVPKTQLTPQNLLAELRQLEADDTPSKAHDNE